MGATKKLERICRWEGGGEVGGRGRRWSNIPVVCKDVRIEPV